MIFGKKGEYAIRALVHLAQARQRCRARDISRDQMVPYDFIAKVLQELKAKGFVRSVRGVGGGFVLARPAADIGLMEVMAAMDCNHLLEKCVYGLAECSDSNPCPLHRDWKPIRSQIEVYLLSHTIADLAAVGTEMIRTETRFSPSALRDKN